MVHIGMVALGMTMLLFLGTFASVFAQETDVQIDEQVTISEDLENNPVAQDILRKIEITKKQIAEIQQKEFESIQAKKELEEKRIRALASLERDLKEWEKLWETFTFEYRFERQHGIFWDQHNFTNSKINAGRAALEKVLENGGNAVDAREAYVDAAKIKRSELIEVNSLYNVRHNLAYYNQQILFDSNGQFHEIISGEQLRKYYEDFRTNPAYLEANPKDEESWNALSKDRLTECRQGYALVHRFHMDDYVCVTESTSEMWARHKMGKIMSDNISQGDDVLSVQKLQEDRTNAKIKNINNKIDSMYGYYEEKLDDVKNKFDRILIDLGMEGLQEEKKILMEYEDGSMSKETLTEKIQDIRAKYGLLEDKTKQAQQQAIDTLESNHEQDMKDFVKNFETVTDVRVKWNSNESAYEVIRT